jgi:hypothetical protein
MWPGFMLMEIFNQELPPAHDEGSGVTVMPAPEQKFFASFFQKRSPALPAYSTARHAGHGPAAAMPAWAQP